MGKLGICDNLGYYLDSIETESEYLSDYCHYKTPVAAKNNLDKLIKFLDKNNYNCYTGKRDDVSAILTENECYRLKEVIFTNEKIRAILKQNQTKEKMMMLKDYRQIREIIHPKKWMVLTKTIYSSI